MFTVFPRRGSQFRGKKVICLLLAPKKLPPDLNQMASLISYSPFPSSSLNFLAIIHRLSMGEFTPRPAYPDLECQIETSERPNPCRGWIRRSSLDMPADESHAQPMDNGKEVETEKGTGDRSLAVVDQQPFQVQSEQITFFPGSWEPLRGKTVNVIMVQKAGDNGMDTGSAAKLAFTKSVFDKAYLEIAKGSTSIDGVIVIFDSDDGGMIASTVPAAASVEDWHFVRGSILASLLLRSSRSIPRNTQPLT